jgi:hypothetical protein
MTKNNKRFTLAEIIMDSKLSTSVRIEHAIKNVLGPRCLELLEAGVITIGVHATLDGTDVWARCTQPHPRLGVDTATSYTCEDIVDLLQKVAVNKVKRNTNTDIRPKASFVMDSKSPETLAEAKQYDRDHNVGSVMLNGVNNILPSDSLSMKDFINKPEAVQARAFLVAEKIGLAKMRSRIASDLRMQVPGARDLNDWWQKANNNQRLTLLSTSSKLGAKVRPTEYISAVLGGLRCPFLDSENTLAKEESEDEEFDTFGVEL